jgi:hypothetical protein
MNDISLCIPRVNGDIKKNMILERFNELNIGKVENIDIIFKNNEKNQNFYSAFIHIQWNNSDLSNYIINRIIEGKDVKIIYDGLLFWKVFMNKSKKPKIRKESTNLWERNKKI